MLRWGGRETTAFGRSLKFLHLSNIVSALTLLSYILTTQASTPCTYPRTCARAHTRTHIHCRHTRERTHILLSRFLPFLCASYIKTVTDDTSVTSEQSHTSPLRLTPPPSRAHVVLYTSAGVCTGAQTHTWIHAYIKKKNAHRKAI